MKKIKVFFAFLAVAVFVVAYDYVFHSVLLGAQYEATAVLWRSSEDMQAYFPVLMSAQIFFSLIFVIFFVLMRPEGGMMCGFGFGFFVGLLRATFSLVWYAVSPLPLVLLLAWVVGNLIQSILAGVLTGAIYTNLTK